MANWFKIEFEWIFKVIVGIQRKNKLKRTTNDKPGFKRSAGKFLQNMSCY